LCGPENSSRWNGVGQRNTKLSSEVFRIDPDDNLNQTTHVQYQPWKKGPWFSVN
jgi:hypothetical protein